VTHEARHTPPPHGHATEELTALVVSEDPSLALAFAGKATVLTASPRDDAAAAVRTLGASVVVVDTDDPTLSRRWLGHATAAHLGTVATPRTERSLAAASLPDAVTTVAGPPNRFSLWAAVHSAWRDQERSQFASEAGQTPGHPGEIAAVAPDESRGPAQIPSEETTTADEVVLAEAQDPAEDEWVPPLLRDRVLGHAAANGLVPPARHGAGPLRPTVESSAHVAAEERNQPRRRVQKPGRSSPPDRTLLVRALSGGSDTNRSRDALNGLADAIERVLTGVDDLLPLDVVGAAVAADLVDSTDAQAAAVMLQDEGTFRTIAGMGLRPAERRGTLDRDHWLVTAVVRRQQCLVIENTEIARRQLQGVPLASRDHLLAVPLPDVEGLLLASRSATAPFDEQCLKAAASSAREASPHLRAALRGTQLASLLVPLLPENSARLRSV
jgi:hypothetical protein